jgi:two-component system, NarL family, sensor histidine kinase DesK
MTGMLTAWRGQSDPQRVDAYTRWTLYGLLASAPLVALSLTSGLGTTGAAAYVAVTLGQTVAAVGVVRGGVAHLVRGVPLSRRWLGALAGTTAVAALLAVVALPLQAEPDRPVRGIALLLTLGLGVMGVSLTLGSRTLLVGGAAVGGVVAVTEVAAGNPGAPLVGGVLAALIVWGMALSFRISGWMLGVVWEQERARTVHARLAVAEERLRFSRDLHDVVGRTLSAIAVKSELAAELARRGQDGAVEQMLEVRELAQDSLREVRGVVSGLRTADLAAELTGARSVLRSAGIETRVVGEDARLPEDVQQALAWVVREAVTNVVRHAHAHRCTIDLDTVEPDGGVTVARLTVTNDGVRELAGREGGDLIRSPAPGSHGAGGSGLPGLRERLAVVGGDLVTSAEGDRFTLRATVPVAAGRPGTMAAR